MSDQAAPKTDDVETNEKKDESKDKKAKDDDDKEEDEGYTCGKCWNGYCACVVAVCKVK
jgi:hypothetical protein